MTDPAGVHTRLRRDMADLANASRDHAQEQHALVQPDVFGRTQSLLSELSDLGMKLATLGWSIKSEAAAAQRARAAADLEAFQKHALDLGRYAGQVAALSQTFSQSVEYEIERRGRSQP